MEESLAYQEFCASAGEEEAWLTEKTTVSLSEDLGDSLAAVQVRERKGGVWYNIMTSISHTRVC